MGTRAAALISVAILAIVIGGVILITSRGGGGSKSSSSADTTAPPVQSASGTGGTRSPAAPVSRSDTTVSVLNGTTTPGLAANVSAELQRGGFKRGSVTNAADQQRPETLVNYAPGYKRPAQEVAQLLKLKTVSPIDPGTQAIAGGDAKVVVTVGTDRTR
jgi:hypothetical protein